MGSLFSTTQKQTNNSTQSGTANTANNIWNDPGIQSSFQQYLSQYSPGNIASVQAPVNSYETNAANAQAGAAAPATGIANQGITPTSIQQYMSPYIQSVVNPTLQAQNIQNQQALSNLGGNQALRGALGNNTGSGAAYLAGVQPAQEATIAGLYNQGYGQAENTAGQSAQTQLAGVNAATGANTAAFNQGQGIQQTSLQNQLLPFSLTDQAASGVQNYGNLAGSNTTTSGQSSGTGTGTTTPGAGTVGLGILGALASFSDERVKDNIKPIGSTFDGQPIYKYNLKGSPKTEIGLMAQDVEQRDPSAVGSFGGIKTVDYDRATKDAERANGGGVMSPLGGAGGSDDFHGKVMKAFHMIQGMKAHARGGAIHRDMGGSTPLQKAGAGLTDLSKNLGATPQGDGGLGQQQSALSQMLSGAAAATRPGQANGGPVHRDMGGDVGLGSWAPVVTPAASGPTSMQKFGSSLTDLSKGMGQTPQGDGGLGQQESALSQMLSGAAASTRPMRPYGGAVDDYSGMSGPVGSPSGAADYGGEYDLRPFYNAVGSAWDKVKGFGARQMQAVQDYDASPPPSMRPFAPVADDVPAILRSRHEDAPVAMASADSDPGMFSPSVQFGDTDAQSPMAMTDTPAPEPARETLPWKLGASGVSPPPAAPAPAAKGSSWRDYLPSVMSDGVWVGDQATPMQRFGAALTQIGDRNPFAGYGKMIMDYPGNTANVSLTQAQALKAAHDANLGYQIQSSNALAAAQRQQEIQRIQGLKAISKRSGTPLDTIAKMTAAPPGPPPVPGAEWYPAYGGWHVPDPNRPGKFLKYNP